jgi:hypothetical protein
MIIPITSEPSSFTNNNYETQELHTEFIQSQDERQNDYEGYIIEDDDDVTMEDTNEPQHHLVSTKPPNCYKETQKSSNCKAVSLKKLFKEAGSCGVKNKYTATRSHLIHQEPTPEVCIKFE